MFHSLKKYIQVLLLFSFVFCQPGILNIGFDIDDTVLYSEDAFQSYIKKNGYPKESVTFSDSYGRIGKIAGINTYKRLLDDPAIQRMRKQIEENN